MSFASEAEETSQTTATAAPHWRDVRWVALAVGLAYLVDFMVITSLLLQLHDRGASGPVISGVLLADAVPLVIAAPLAGRLSDRLDSRTLLEIAGAIEVLACLGLAWAGSTAAVLALVALLAVGLALAGPTLNALLPMLVERELLVRANGLITSFVTVGLVLGPAAGGLLTGLLGHRAPVLAGALLSVMFVLVSLQIETHRRGQVQADAGFRAGVALLRTDRVLSRLLVLTAALILLLQITNVFEVFLIRDTLRAGPTAFGAMIAVWAGGMFAGSWLAAGGIGGRPAASDATMLRQSLLATAVQALALMSVAVVPDIALLVPVFLIGGAGNGAMNVLRQTVFGRRAPEHARGRIFSAASAVNNLAAVVSLGVGGLLADLLDPGLAYAGCGGLCLLAALGFAPSLLRSDDVAQAGQGTGGQGPDHDVGQAEGHPAVGVDHAIDTEDDVVHRQGRPGLG